jgi:hypothetical protein
MRNKRSWLRKHKFESTLAAFLLITLPSAALYLAAQAGAAGWAAVLIALVIFGNLLAMAVD